MHIIPLFSTIVIFGFTVVVFLRYLNRKGPHLLLWSFGLLLYGLGTLSEVLLSFGFNAFLLKLWYLTGAMLTAAWLGQGSVHLLVRKPRIAWILTTILGIISLIAAGLIFLAPISASTATFNPALPVSTQYKEFLTRTGAIIALTIVLNIYGTVTLVGGTIYSAFLFWRKQVMLKRVVGNLFIAIGALFPAMAGSLVKAGVVDALYISELIGAVLMFIGFILATSTSPVTQIQPTPTES